MAAVRRLPVLLLVVAALSACGGGSTSAPPSTTTDAVTANPATARSTTVAEKTARFTLLIDAVVGGATVQSSETGTINFTKRLAHLYKLVPGGRTPQEGIVDGPYTHTHAYGEAALKGTAARPRTKLDTRRLSLRRPCRRPC